MQRYGREWRAVVPVPSDQFHGEMLRLGRRTAVASHQQTATCRQQIGQLPAPPQQRRSLRGQRLQGAMSVGDARDRGGAAESSDHLRRVC